MIKNPAIASLDSAKGPSVTAFLPATILPLCSNGCPLLKFPAFFRRSNHEVNLAILFWISSGERSLGQLVPRKSSKYSEVVVFAVIINATQSHLGCTTEMRPEHPRQHRSHPIREKLASDHR